MMRAIGALFARMFGLRKADFKTQLMTDLGINQ